MASPSADDSVPPAGAAGNSTVGVTEPSDLCGSVMLNEHEAESQKPGLEVSEKNGEDVAKESGQKDDDENKSNAAFECNICLDVARDAVISMCGHLFCWPCLHTWLETRPHRQICPVCKAGIGKDKVVPIYGRGDSNPKDPRDKPLPPRPRGQRPEPETNAGGDGGFAFFGGGGAFHMSFGIGAFPFGLFTTNLNFGDHFGGPRVNQGAQEGSAQFEEEQFLQKAFLWVAFAFIFWLLIA